jgi:hypothetical protein
MEAERLKTSQHDSKEARKPAENETSIATRNQRLYDLVIVFNGLLAMFTVLVFGLIVFVLYLTAIPQVVISPDIVDNFGVGKKPTMYVSLDNTGRTDAKAVRYGIAAGLLPFPLNSADLEPVPAWSGPTIRLFPDVRLSLSATLPTLAANQVDAIRDGQHWALYIWGTVEYRDFLYVWGHRRNFCFSYSGPNLKQAGICAVNRAGTFVRLDAQQERQTPFASLPTPTPLPPE